MNRWTTIVALCLLACSGEDDDKTDSTAPIDTDTTDTDTTDTDTTDTDTTDTDTTDTDTTETGLTTTGDTATVTGGTAETGVTTMTPSGGTGGFSTTIFVGGSGHSGDSGTCVPSTTQVDECSYGATGTDPLACPTGTNCQGCLTIDECGNSDVVNVCVTDGVACGRPMTQDKTYISSSSDHGPAFGDDMDTSAALWTDLALEEHASIASFAKFSMQLMALGAPLSILGDAQQAALDEVVHATDAFALASRFAGRQIRPTAMPLPDQLALEATPEQVAMQTLIYGACNESLACAMALERRAQVTDPQLQAALDKVIDDEGRHAALALRTLAWLLGKHPELKPALRQAIADYQPKLVADPGQAAHGALDITAKERALHRATSQICQPAFAALGLA